MVETATQSRSIFLLRII